MGRDVSACPLEVSCALEFFLLHFRPAMLPSLLGLFSSCFWVCSFSERSHEAKELFGSSLTGLWQARRFMGQIRTIRVAKKIALGIPAGGCMDIDRCCFLC